MKSQNVKINVGLAVVIVLCSLEYIEGSCLSYGHSCWGAHGKRSYTPQRDLQNDRWALFKLPEKNDVYPMRRLNNLRGNQQGEIDEDLPKEIIFPGLEHRQQQQPSLMSSEEEVAVVEAKDISNENEIFQQKHKPLGQRVPFIEDYKPPYVVRFNKQNSNNFVQ